MEDREGQEEALRVSENKGEAEAVLAPPRDGEALPEP